MKTGEIDFHFPVLGFTENNIWGFQDLDRLTRCGPRTLRDGAQLGMELVDSKERRWIVRSVRRVGSASSLLHQLLFFVFGPPQSRIEQELEAMSLLPIEEIKRRACSAMQANAISYLEGDDPELHFKPLLARVEQARSVGEVYDLLQPDTFEAH
jgi:hypothetical protein